MFKTLAVLAVVSAGGEKSAEETYPLRARFLFDGEPAPPGATLKLLDERLSGLCGTSRMSSARTARPEPDGWFDFGQVRASTYTLLVEHPALGAIVHVPSSEVRWRWSGPQSPGTQASRRRSRSPMEVSG